MRDFSQFRSSFWTGETGQQLRKHGDAQRLAAYLFTSPHANIIGFYWLPTLYASRETGLTEEGVSEALRRLSDLDFAHYDAPLELVWVVNMAREQLNLAEGEKLSEKDNRGKAARKAADALRRSQLYPRFFTVYGETLDLPRPRSPLKGPSGPPCKGESTASEEQNRTETEQNRTERSRPAAPAAGVLALGDDPTGPTDAATEPAPTESAESVGKQLAELERRYPAEVVAEARTACGLSRRTGKMSDSVWLTTLKTLSAHPTAIVERAMRLFIERYADGEKDERYLIGIVRKDVRPMRSAPPTGTRALPSRGTTAADFEGVGSVDEQLRRYQDGAR